MGGRAEVIQASLSVHRFGSAGPPGLGPSLAMVRAAQVELYGRNPAGCTVQADMRGDCPMTGWGSILGPELAVRPGWEPSEEQDCYPIW